MPSKDRKLIILEDGREAYKYPDGSIRNASGSYAVAPPWKHPDFDSEIGSALATKRQEMIREAAAKGLVEGHKVDSEYAAAKAGTKAMAEMIEEKKGVASVQAFRASWQAAGWLQERGDNRPTIQQNFLVMPPGVLRSLGVRGDNETDMPEAGGNDSESETP